MQTEYLNKPLTDQTWNLFIVTTYVTLTAMESDGFFYVLAVNTEANVMWRIYIYVCVCVCARARVRACVSEYDVISLHTITSVRKYKPASKHTTFSQ
jgi:hypothetical protein